jgi:hypothetical protein
MHLPHTFPLKGRRWTVELVDKIDMMEDGKVCHGFCYTETRTIEILEGLNRHKTLRAFIHEFLHAVEFEYKIKIPHWLIYKIDGPLATMFGLIMQHNQ